MNSTLELKPCIRAGAQYTGGASKSERHFLDFVVDGRSLWEFLGKRRDLVSVLCLAGGADNFAQIVGRLLLSEKADLSNDRRALFVCSECGDLGCGAVTALIEKQGETIAWKAFGFQNNYEENVWFENYSTVGPFLFDAVGYQKKMVEGLELLRRADF